MGVRDFFGKLFSPVSVVVQPVFRNISYARLFGQSEKMKAAELLKHYRHWVYRAATMNANSVAAVPLRLYVTTNRSQKSYPNMRKGIDTKPVSKQQFKWLEKNSGLVRRLSKAVLVEEVIEHPFLSLWESANQQYDGFELKELWELFAELTGDAYLWMQLNSLGIPQSFWVLQSQHLTIVPGEGDEFIRGYIYGTSFDNQVALEANEVAHLRFPNPHNVFYGMSPMQSVISAVKRKEDMDAYEASLLKNNARPDFLIKHKGKVNTKTLKEIRERWMQLYSGGKSGMPAVLEGEMELEKLGFSPREMAFLKGQKFSRDEILNAFGVPISKVTTEAVNLANADIGETQYQRDTIVPRLKRQEQKLNQDVLPKFDDRLFVAYDNPVPEDKAFALEKSDRYLKNGVITINEVREKEGLEPVSWGKSAWMPFNLLPVGSERPADNGNGDGKSHTKHSPAEFHVHFKDGKVEMVDTKDFWYMSAVSRMRSIMRSIFLAWQKNMLKKLEEMKALVPAGINAKGEGVPEWTEELLEREKWAAEINRRMAAPIRQQLIRGGTRGAHMLGTGISFDVLNPEVVTWFDEYVFHFSDVVSRDVSDSFAAEMRRGFEAGETIPELTTRTRGFFGKMQTWKAEQVARTESTRAAHQGMLKSWEQSGVVEAIVWDGQPDMCPWCAEMDGKVVSLGQPFFEQGGHLDANFQDAEGNLVARTLKFNYEQVSAPPLHPNCRCTLRAELKDI